MFQTWIKKPEENLIETGLEAKPCFSAWCWITRKDKNITLHSKMAKKHQMCWKEYSNVSGVSSRGVIMQTWNSIRMLELSLKLHRRRFFFFFFQVHVHSIEILFFFFCRISELAVLCVKRWGAELKPESSCFSSELMSVHACYIRSVSLNAKWKHIDFCCCWFEVYKSSVFSQSCVEQKLVQLRSMGRLRGSIWLLSDFSKQHHAKKNPWTCYHGQLY